jgi:hypothetical protein
MNLVRLPREVPRVLALVPPNIREAMAESILMVMGMEPPVVVAQRDQMEPEALAVMQVIPKAPLGAAEEVAARLEPLQAADAVLPQEAVAPAVVAPAGQVDLAQPVMPAATAANWARHSALAAAAAAEAFRVTLAAMAVRMAAEAAATAAPVPRASSSSHGRMFLSVLVL